jgi:hypothetical protein
MSAETHSKIHSNVFIELQTGAICLRRGEIGENKMVATKRPDICLQHH